ncbi:flagellar basal body protein FliL [Micromonospora sp. NPDC051196]|uniref:LppU/SCO3897 family protein n=1 Tax=Micromonospora sp. NPDC051196 TaxID=3155281 RepID=UPI00343EEABD
MANYGPPGGGPQPWHEPRSGEVHGRGQVYGSGQPYDSGQHYDSGQPYGSWPPYGSGQGYGGYPQDGRDYQHDSTVAAYAGQPTPPPERRRGRAPLIAALVAVLVLAVGGGTAFYLIGQDDESTPAAAAAPTQDPPVQTTDPQDEEDDAGGDAPAAGSATDPRFVRQGQCVRNDAPSGGKPKLLISDCTPSAYEVLQRFDGTTSGEKDAEAKCARVDGYTNWYFYDSELDSLDFVLCLKRRG